MTTAVVWYQIIGWYPTRRQSRYRGPYAPIPAGMRCFRMGYPILSGPGALRFEQPATVLQISLSLTSRHQEPSWSVGWYSLGGAWGKLAAHSASTFSWLVAHTVPSGSVIASVRIDSL